MGSGRSEVPRRSPAGPGSGSSRSGTARPGSPGAVGRSPARRSAGGRSPAGGPSGRESPPARSGGPRRESAGPAAAWGGVARRGARNVDDPTPRPGSAAEAWRKANPPEKGDRDRGRPEAFEPDRWVDEGPVREEAQAAIGRAGTASARRRRRLPEEVDAEVERTAGLAWAGRVKDRLADAVHAYEGERYRDARRILEGLLERAPSSVAVRELYGLTLYRMGRWREASRELGAVELLTGSVDHHPVLADCQRALGNRDRVRELWDELRRAGASVDVVVEGRIVMAGALADGGDLRAAIQLLEQGPVNVRRPQAHHLRLWYALANLAERVGDPVRARGLFARIVAADPLFADAGDRLHALGG